jgi:hypothetical protein
VLPVLGLVKIKDQCQLLNKQQKKALNNKQKKEE